MFMNGQIICPRNADCSLYCEYSYACRNANITAENSPNTNVILVADGYGAFQGGKLYGAVNGSVNVECLGQDSCKESLIKASEHSLSVDVNAAGSYVLYSSEIYCPNNGVDKEIICDLDVSGQHAIQLANLYTFEAFHDVRLVCDPSYTQGCYNMKLYCNIGDDPSSCVIELKNKNKNTWRCNQFWSDTCETFEYTAMPTMENLPSPVPTQLPTAMLITTLTPSSMPTTEPIETMTYIPSSTPTAEPILSTPSYFPSILPTHYPTNYPITTTQIADYTFSVNFVAEFEYETKADQNLTSSVLENITIALIETQTMSISDAPTSSEYVIEWSPEIYLVVLNITIYVADNYTMHLLSVHILNNLQSDLYGILQNHNEVLVSRDDIEIASISTSHDAEVHETTTAPTSLPTASPSNLKDESAKIDTTDTTVIIIASCVVTVVCCLFLFLILYIRKLKKDQHKIEEMMQKTMEKNESKASAVQQPEVPNLDPFEGVASASLYESSEEKEAEAKGPGSFNGSNPRQADSSTIHSVLSQAQMFKLPPSPIDETDDYHNAYAVQVQRTVSTEGQPDSPECKMDFMQTDDPQLPQIVYDGTEQLELKQWLMTNCGELICKHYFETIISNGYQSLDFLKEMQSQKDLEEIGICWKAHKEKIWSEIEKLKDCADWLIDLEIENNAATRLEVENWLQRACGEEICALYLDDFMRNGYDSMDFIKEMPSISDLEEIGIKSKENLNIIWSEIQKLKPIETPNGIDQNRIVYDGEEQLEIRGWLKEHCGDVICEQYFRVFVFNGFQSLDFIKAIEHQSDLEEIGISSKEHIAIIWTEVQKLKHDSADVMSTNEQLDVRKWLETNCGSDICTLYFETFMSNGYTSLDIIKEIEGVADLNEIGIYITEHQQKIVSEIIKLKQLFYGD